MYSQCEVIVVIGQLGSFPYLSEEGVYTETLEKFYLSSVLNTHSCL